MHPDNLDPIQHSHIWPPARRAIVLIDTSQLERDLDIDARILDARYDHERQALRVLVTRDDLDTVAWGCEPYAIDRDDVRLGGHNPDPWQPEDGADFYSAIAQAVGAASVAWTRPPSSIFDSGRAKAVVDGLADYLAERDPDITNRTVPADPWAQTSPDPEPPILIGLADADPQFTVTTRINHRLIDQHNVPDPLAHTVIVIDPEDFPTDGGPLRVTVDMGATRAGLRHVMRPIDLSPNDEQPAAPSGFNAALDGPTWPVPQPGTPAGPGAPGVDTSRPDDHGILS